MQAPRHAPGWICGIMGFFTLATSRRFAYEPRREGVPGHAASRVRRGTPERLLRPLASAVAYEIFGNTDRWSEVLSLVEAALKSDGGSMSAPQKSRYPRSSNSPQ